jgi:hypothetical protein
MDPTRLKEPVAAIEEEFKATAMDVAVNLRIVAATINRLRVDESARC